MADPRSAPAAPVAADPRMRSIDPRTTSVLSDPRSQAAPAPALAQPAGYEPQQVDPRTAIHHPYLPTAVPVVTAAPVHRPAPEINGKFTHPMEFKLIPVFVEVRTYIPAGAENSQEMLRDPRIKKRVLSLKKEPSQPSLPDITADLQRIQNARLSANPVPVNSRQTSRTSIDSLSDPRRSSLDGRQPLPARGQGDQNSNTEGIVENGSKARNATRTAMSKVNPMPAGSGYSSAQSTAAYDDDDENNSLTIDMPEEESKSVAQPMEAACT